MKKDINARIEAIVKKLREEYAKLVSVPLSDTNNVTHAQRDYNELQKIKSDIKQLEKELEKLQILLRIRTL